MATFTVDGPVNVHYAGMDLVIQAGATASCPDDLFDEVEAVIEARPGVTVTHLTWDREEAGSGNVEDHEAEADPHTGYQLESEKGQASGYASLDANTRVPVAQLGSGTANSTKLLDGAGAWVDKSDIGVTAHSALTGLSEFDHDQYVRGTDGGRETIQAHGAAGSAETFDLANANYHTVTLDAATCTATLSGALNGVLCSMTIVATQDSAGSRTIEWADSITWLAGYTPILHSTASAVDVFALWSSDGGTTWLGRHINDATGGGPLLTYKIHAAGSESTASTALVDVDAVNAIVTFTAPPSGNVLVRLTASANAGLTSGAYCTWALHEDSTVVAGAIGDSIAVRSTGGSVLQFTGVTKAFYISGLTAGASHSYKWAWAVSVGTAELKSSSDSPAVMEVWAL